VIVFFSLLNRSRAFPRAGRNSGKRQSSRKKSRKVCDTASSVVGGAIFCISKVEDAAPQLIAEQSIRKEDHRSFKALWPGSNGHGPC
jgi:hypothetical protein